MLIHIPCILMLLVLLATHAAAGEDDWGTLRGEIRVTGEVPRLPNLAPAAGLCPAIPVPEESLLVDAETGGLQNVAIYLRKSPTRIHPSLQDVPARPQQLFLQDCRFVPRMLITRVGQDVEVYHDDPITHALRWHGFKNTIRPHLAVENPEIVRLTDPERIPIKLACDVHPYMTGWWVALDHPYAAISNGQGAFEIRFLPTGDHNFILWHERKGYIHKSLRVTIAPGENVLPTITVPVEELTAR